MRRVDIPRREKCRSRNDGDKNALATLQENFDKYNFLRFYHDLILVSILVFFFHFLHSAVALLLHLLALQLLGRLLLLGRLIIISRSFHLDVVLFGEDNFDMAGRGHVGVDSAVGAVRSAPHLRGAIDLDVIDDEVVDVEAFVIRVRFRVLQQRKEEFGGFLGPTSLTAGCVPGFCLSVATGASNVASERNNLFLLADILEEFGSASERHSFDGFSGFARVLVMDAQVGATRLDRLGGILGISGITRHCADLTKT